MPSDAELIEGLLDVCHRLHRAGTVAANDGNVSAVCDDGNILRKKPSSELLMHLAIYQDRPDVKAVVHAHLPYATGFAAAGLALDKCVLPEIVMTLGSIPLAAYGTPSTEEVPESVSKWIGQADAVLLANHGAVTVGSTLMEAFYRMERIEHYARICFIARQLGGERLLTPEEVQKIYSLREESGMTNLNPGCWTCDTKLPDSCVGDVCVNYDENGADFEATARRIIKDLIRRSETQDE